MQTSKGSQAQLRSTKGCPDEQVTLPDSIAVCWKRGGTYLGSLRYTHHDGTPGPLRLWLLPLACAASGCEEHLASHGSREETCSGALLFLSMMETVPKLASQGMLG